MTQPSLPKSFPRFPKPDPTEQVLAVLRQPTAIAVVASLGLHGLAAVSLPLLPQPAPEPEERTIKVVELSPMEQLRLPQAAPPAITFGAPTATPPATSLFNLPSIDQVTPPTQSEDTPTPDTGNTNQNSSNSTPSSSDDYLEQLRRMIQESTKQQQQAAKPNPTPSGSSQSNTSTTTQTNTQGSSNSQPSSQASGQTGEPPANPPQPPADSQTNAPTRGTREQPSQTQQDRNRQILQDARDRLQARNQQSGPRNAPVSLMDQQLTQQLADPTLGTTESAEKERTFKWFAALEQATGVEQAKLITTAKQNEKERTLDQVVPCPTNATCTDKNVVMFILAVDPEGKPIGTAGLMRKTGEPILDQQAKDTFLKFVKQDIKGTGKLEIYPIRVVFNSQAS